jgi:hypothetical protein
MGGACGGVTANQRGRRFHAEERSDDQLKELANSELTVDDVPGPDDELWIMEFALTFDGYEHYGGFEACADACNAAGRRYFTEGPLPGSLTELRACLFFEQRRWHHYGDSPDAETRRYMAALLDGIRGHVARGDLE